MTLTLETLGQERLKAAKRQRAGVLNRYLGWAILPMVVAAVILHYAGGDGSDYNAVAAVLQFIFVPLMFVHVGLSYYVFGLVRPARTLRVFHVWFGYAYMFLVLGSQTTHDIEPIHTILTIAMFTCLTVHVAIGVYYAARRREARVERTPLAG